MIVANLQNDYLAKFYIIILMTSYSTSFNNFLFKNRKQNKTMET